MGKIRNSIRLAAEKVKAIFTDRNVAIISMLVTILALIAAFLIAADQNEIAKYQSELAALSSPVLWDFHTIESDQVVYSFDSAQAPAREAVISLKSGIFKDITVIEYDGETYQYILNLDTISSDVFVEGATYTFSTIGQCVFDDIERSCRYEYFFLLTESVGGQREIWLIIYLIQIGSDGNIEVSDYRFDPFILLAPHFPLRYGQMQGYPQVEDVSNPKNSPIPDEILTAYSSLISDISALFSFQ